MGPEVWRELQEFADENAIAGFCDEDNSTHKEHTIDYDYQESEDDQDSYTLSFTVKNNETQVEVASFKLNGHPNVPIQAMGADMALISGPDGGEDAFYGNMRLVEWRSGAVKTIIPLENHWGYIECEWPRGMLPGA